MQQQEKVHVQHVRRGRILGLVRRHVRYVGRTSGLMLGRVRVHRVIRRMAMATVARRRPVMRVLRRVR